MNSTHYHIILFGSTGMLGNYVKKYFEQFPEKYSVHTINRNEYDVIKNSFQDLQNILRDFKQKFFSFDHPARFIVINAIGIIPQTKINSADLYIRINSIFPHILAQICDRFKWKMIHATTDCVFDGKRGLYYETDEANATSIYGISKFQGEPSNACVIRTSIIGEEISNHRSLLEWIKSKQDSPTSVRGYVNHYWNGITCLEWAKIVRKIIEQDLWWTGVRHVHSPKPVSKGDIIEMINEIYEFNVKIQHYKTLDDVDRTLFSIHKLPFDIPPILDQIKELKRFSLQ